MKLLFKFFTFGLFLTQIQAAMTVDILEMDFGTVDFGTVNVARRDTEGSSEESGSGSKSGAELMAGFPVKLAPMHSLLMLYMPTARQA